MHAFIRWCIRLCIVVAALGAALLFWQLSRSTPVVTVPTVAAAAPDSDRLISDRLIAAMPPPTPALQVRAALPVTLPCADAVPGQQPLPANGVEQAFARLGEKLSDELARSAQPREQALGRYLSAISRAALAEQAYRQRHPGCDDDAACAAGMKAEGARAQEDDLLALSRLAAGGSDAAVYGLADAQCAAQPKERRSAACLQINAAQWSQLAPDRLEPRIAAAHEAWVNGNQTELYLALHKVAQFAGSFAVSRPADSLLGTPAMAALTEGEQRLASMMVVESGQAVALDGIVSSYCSGDKLIDPNQRQLCNTLAEKMVAPGGTVRQVMAGALLGRKLGWPAERVDNARREAKAVNRYLIKELGGSAANTCAAWRKQAAIAHGIVHQGEMATYRRLIPADQLSADPTLHRPLMQGAAQPALPR